MKSQQVRKPKTKKERSQKEKINKGLSPKKPDGTLRNDYSGY